MRFIQALPELIPSVKVLGASRQAPADRERFDLVVDILTPLGRKRKLFVEVQPAAAPSRAREAITRLKTLRLPSYGYPVLASTFLSPRMREICREEGVGYLDLAGNSLLRFDDLYVEKIVDKNPFPVRGRPPSLFGPVSSRILRALLEEPSRRWRLAELARESGASLGQVSGVTRRLVAEGYAQRHAGGFYLDRPGTLLDSWRESGASSTTSLTGYYSFEQDPRRLLGRLAHVGKEQGLRYAVSSFAAASLIAPFVRGIGVVQWYVEDELAVDRWVKALDLRPVEGGPNVALRVPLDAGVFYRARPIRGVLLVGNIQLYLDLCRESARGREQAEFLRKKKLGF